MRRQFIIVIAMLSILWQGFAVGSVGTFADAIGDAEHASLHWNEVSHHHHDDGTLTRDNSSDSALHMAMDLTLPSMMTFTALEVPHLAANHVRPAYLAHRRVAPYLDSLQRPPSC